MPIIDRNRLKMRPPPNMYQWQISTKICLKSLVTRKYTNKTHNNLLLHGSSAGKWSSCNAGDPGLIPGSGRSAGERIGYPLQYSWTSLVVQTAKNLPAMWETWVWSLGWEDSGEGNGYPLWYSNLKNPHAQRSLAGYTPWDPKELGMTQELSLLLPYGY